MKKILLGIMIFETLIMSTFCENLSLEMVSIPNKNFEMSKTEVTQKLYESVMGENPSKFKGENNPVENVSWYDAISFCNKMSEKEGLQPVYTVDGKTDILNYISFKDDKINVEIIQNPDANGYRLPSVEEWQYAAKGGENYKYAGSNDIDEVAWYDKNSNGKTHVVAQKKANGYGLYDISGNVNEWCWDSGFYGHYHCGGSWHGIKKYCNIRHKFSGKSDFKFQNFGFRIVRTVK